MKINFRKSLVNVAVASAVGAAALVSLPAHAINISTNNVGQVLLFPFYTVKNGFDTIFTVTNTSNRTVIAKIRWREALNSREVRDFNIALSPYDMWTAGVTIDSTGNGALVRTFDKSCTSPALTASTAQPGSTEIEFTSIGYDGNSALGNDNGGTALSRVQEGYFEVISMGEFAALDENVAVNLVPYNSKHGATGVPRDCSVFAGSTDDNYDTTDGGTALLAPRNVLKGAVSYIDVATGRAVDVAATHIENWTTIVQWALPSDAAPDLSDGSAGEAVNLLNNGVAITHLAGVYAPPEDKVTALLMADAVINEFVSDATATATDWVFTFPTKHFYTDGVAEFPFGVDFTVDGTSCNDYAVTLYNREEGTIVPSGNSFSPRPVGSTAQFCYEVNVLTFNGANVFGTGVNHQSVPTTAVGSAGWASVALSGFTGGVAAPSDRGIGGTVIGAGAVPTVDSLTTPGDRGLPVIGFAAVNRNNASVSNNNRNYGSTVNHAYVRN